MNKFPDTVLDLVNCPRVAALTTVMPDGQPQTTVVWYDFDGLYVQVNTIRGFRKEKNMRADPRVTLLCFNPREPLRSLEFRGEVELIYHGAMEHLDQITRQYTRHPQYYGYIYPLEQRERETRIICRTPARKITRTRFTDNELETWVVFLRT